MKPGSGHALWEVWVNQTFHLSGEAEQYRVGVFASCEEARASCRRLILEFLESQAAAEDGSEDLLAAWQEAGPEPWIQASDPGAEDGVECRFSAVEFVRRVSSELRRPGSGARRSRPKGGT